MVIKTGLTFLIFSPFVMGLICYLAGAYCTRKRAVKGAGRTLGLCPRESLPVQPQENLRDILAVVTVVLEFLYAAMLVIIFCMELGGKERLPEVLQVLLVRITTYMELEESAEFSGMLLTLPKICGFGLNFTLDGFRAVYICVAAFMWMMVTIFSREYFASLHNRSRFYLFLLWTLGATMGVFLSADLYTTFIFFEIMSFTSYVWVAQEENENALQAASTYLTVAVLGGLVMLMGIFLLYHQLGTVTIGELRNAAAACSDRKTLYLAGGCMLFGFGAKAGAFPLHIWLPKAHPVAPAPASALLSGILTKTGIYGILILSCQLFLQDSFWGSIVLALGVITMFWGALLALFSIDLKRTLACSSMSQIGFILVGISMQGIAGEENVFAVHGTFLHMVNHSMIKLVLFMAAGVVYMNTRELDLNKIRGFGRKKPLLAAVFLTGALAIGGIPLFGGYISKTLLHESIVACGNRFALKAVEGIFLFSGGMTVAYMTKLFAAIFLEKNEDPSLQKKYDAMYHYMSPATTFALAGSTAVLFIWGLFPHTLMDKAAYLAQSFMGMRAGVPSMEEIGHPITYFSLENLKGAFISIAIGAALYFLFIRKILLQRGEKSSSEYSNAWPKWLDLEELVYRPLLLKTLPGIFGGVCSLLNKLCDNARIGRILSTICGIICRIPDTFLDGIVIFLRKTLYRDSPLPHERTEGNVLTETAGKTLNVLQAFQNHILRKQNPIHKDYVHLIAMKNEQFKETNHIIQRSLSFGLLLFCIGLSLTLLYIIWW